MYHQNVDNNDQAQAESYGLLVGRLTLFFDEVLLPYFLESYSAVAASEFLHHCCALLGIRWHNLRKGHNDLTFEWLRLIIATPNAMLHRLRPSNLRSEFIVPEDFKCNYQLKNVYSDYCYKRTRSSELSAGLDFPVDNNSPQAAVLAFFIQHTLLVLLFERLNTQAFAIGGNNVAMLVSGTAPRTFLAACFNFQDDQVAALFVKLAYIKHYWVENSDQQFVGLTTNGLKNRIREANFPSIPAGPYCFSGLNISTALLGQ